jgi:hypothetical protein
MSLINDALQRAKQVQQTNPPPPTGAELQLRPADPAQPQAKGLGLMIPVVVIGLLILGAVLIAALFPNSQASRSPREGARVSDAPPAPAIKPGFPGSLPVLAQAAESAGTTNRAAPMAEVAPATPTPRLQAIFFSTARPSAIINGKTVYVKDRVGDYQVTRISRNSATLVSATETHVLTLED